MGIRSTEFDKVKVEQDQVGSGIIPFRMNTSSIERPVLEFVDPLTLKVVWPTLKSAPFLFFSDGKYRALKHEVVDLRCIAEASLNKNGLFCLEAGVMNEWLCAYAIATSDSFCHVVIVPVFPNIKDVKGDPFFDGKTWTYLGCFRLLGDNLFRVLWANEIHKNRKLGS